MFNNRGFGLYIKIKQIGEKSFEMECHVPFPSTSSNLSKFRYKYFEILRFYNNNNFYVYALLIKITKSCLVLYLDFSKIFFSAKLDRDERSISPFYPYSNPVQQISKKQIINSHISKAILTFETKGKKGGGRRRKKEGNLVKGERAIGLEPSNVPPHPR